MARRTARFDSRLIGEWVSDREMTFRHFVPRPESTPEKLIKFQELFGKMRIRWGYRKYQWSIDGPMTTESYRVIDRDCESVVIRIYDPIFHWQLRQIHFEDDHYWLWAWGMREFFRRVTPSN